MKILKKHYKISDAIQVGPNHLVYVDQLIMKLETIQGAFLFVLAKESHENTSKLRAMHTVSTCLQEVIDVLQCGLYGYDSDRMRY